jgi:hypothetical protein
MARDDVFNGLPGPTAAPMMPSGRADGPRLSGFFRAGSRSRAETARRTGDRALGTMSDDAYALGPRGPRTVTGYPAPAPQPPLGTDP